MRLPIALLLLIKASFVQSCALEGEVARACGGSTGKTPKNCCAGLECQSGVCVTPGNGGDGGDGCPSLLKVDCIAWTTSGGRCQALHFIARVINEDNEPVNGAEVTYITSTPNGDVGPNTKETSAGLFSSYASSLESQCDPLDDSDMNTQGTIDAVCFQKALEGWYEAIVTSVELPGCPNAQFDDESDLLNSAYEYLGRC